MGFTAQPVDGSSPTPLPMPSAVPDGTNTPFVTEGGPAKTTGGNTLAPVATYQYDGYNVVEGQTTDAAVTGDNAGTLSAKLRGLSKILTDIWDSVNHRIKVDGSGVTQPVSGTFWQATQPVNGTVTANQGGSNWTINNAQVAGTAIDTNSGNKSAGTQRVVLATDQPAVPVSGTVSVNALPAGSNLIGSVELVDSAGTNKAAIDSAGNQQVKGGFAEIAGQAAGSVTSTSTDLIPSTDMSGYSFAILQLSGTWTMTFQAQWSNDNFATAPVAGETGTIGASGPSTSITTNGMYVLPKYGRFLRIRPSAFTSNASCVGTLECYTQISPQLLSFVFASQSGTWTVQPGNTANTTPWLVNAQRNTVAVYSLASTVTTGSTQNSGDLAVGPYAELSIDITTTAQAGTSPTIQYFYERKAADGNYYPIWQSAVLTLAANTLSTSIGAGMAYNQSLGATGRLRWVVGGSATPTFTHTINLQAK